MLASPRENWPFPLLNRSRQLQSGREGQNEIDHSDPSGFEMQLAGERVTLGRQPVPPTTRAAEIEVVLSPYGTFTVVSFELDVVFLTKFYCIRTH